MTNKHTLQEQLNEMVRLHENQASDLLVCIIDKTTYQQFLSFAVEHELGFRKALYVNEVKQIMFFGALDDIADYSDDFQSSNDWRDSGCVDDPEEYVKDDEWVSSSNCW